MDEQLKEKKLEIASKAGALHDEIASLMKMIAFVLGKKEGINRDGLPDSLTVQMHIDGNSSFVIRSREWDPDGTALHDALLMFLNLQLERKEKELDDLIKVMM